MGRKRSTLKLPSGKRRNGASSSGMLLSQLLPPLPSHYIRPVPTLPPEIWGMIMDYIDDELTWGRWKNVCHLFWNLTLGDPFPLTEYRYFILDGGYYSTLRKAISSRCPTAGIPYRELEKMVRDRKIRVSECMTFLTEIRPNSSYYYSGRLREISDSERVIRCLLLCEEMKSWNGGYLTPRQNKLAYYLLETIRSYIGYADMKSALLRLPPEKLDQLWKEFIEELAYYGYHRGMEIEKITML